MKVDSKDVLLPCIQWLTSLFCFFTSFESTLLDSRKHTDTLRYIIQQKKDEIIKSYGHIAEIIGPDILQKLVPLPHPHNTETLSIQPLLNHLLPLFSVLLIQLLPQAQRALILVISFLSKPWTLSSAIKLICVLLHTY